jgi:hypothetical protein
MVTVRELFHSLGNKHNLITVGCGVTKDLAEDCLNEAGISNKHKENLSQILKNLTRLEKDAQQADKITAQLQDKIYKVLDPDTGNPK